MNLQIINNKWTSYLIFKTIYFIALLPQFITRIPYLFFYYFAKIFLKKEHTKLWCRNSFYLNYFVPGLSDIDLTLYLFKDFSVNKLHFILKKYHFLQKIIPIIGEINIIQQKNINDFVPCANFYDLMKDPLLKEASCLTKEESLLTFEEKFVYLLKMYQSDQHNLKKIFYLRHKKWNFVLQQIGLGPCYLDTNGISSLKDLIISLQKNFFNYSTQLNIQIFLQDISGEISYEKRLRELFKKNIYTKEFILCFPFIWMGEAIKNQSFEIYLKEIKQYSFQEQTILSYHMNWEIWGLYTQYLQIKNKKEVIIHLDHMVKLYRSLILVNNEKSIYQIERLKSLCLDSSRDE